MKLQGKNIVLTGGSSGFGRFLAWRLFEEGANLVIISRSLVSDWPQQTFCKGQISKSFQVDILNDITAALQLIVALGPFDGLVNNAAIQGPIGHFWGNDIQYWKDTLVMDLLIPVSLCDSVIPHMLKRGHGKIVNLSGGGATSPRPNYSAYATAKAGLVRFSECLAAELKGTGIDVNCVSPGKMPTGMLPPGETPDEDSMEKAADLIVWLLSSESDGITGRLISAIWDHWKVANLTPMSDELYTLRRIDEDHDRAYRHWKESPVREPVEGANNL